ncbi:glycosyltransferase [Microbacterium sp. CH1]|uniref:glycosyltransferase n=1 Tax=Microbacterium sp. CH1 TaxID=1770208 RepID=UPI000787853E|nr:glycosyltransferase [Microbacterium sp. CH1]KYJ99896.1 glycosyl transferase [Microbacterium sp. CH1]
MGARLRVVLDQLVHVVDPDQAWASRDLATGLVQTAPPNCAVDAIVPAGAEVALPGIGDVRSLPIGRRELAASWQLGIAPGVGGGLIHAPTLLAPLVRHDRVHDNDQTTVTLWDLRAWEAPSELSRAAVAWHRGMVRRAVRHADAVVVPSHAMAERLSELTKLGDRLRVIAGASPRDLRVPVDARRRREELSLPEDYVVLAGPEQTLSAGFRGAVAAGLDAVVLGAGEGAEPRLAEVAAAAGLPERRAHIRGTLDGADRAAVLSGSRAFIATDPISAWPWRAVEAMTVGAAVVAVDSGAHRDVIADGGLLVSAEDIPDAVADVAGDAGDRLRVLAADRARAFSWDSSAERVWALHADL